MKNNEKDKLKKIMSVVEKKMENKLYGEITITFENGIPLKTKTIENKNI